MRVLTSLASIWTAGAVAATLTLSSCGGGSSSPVQAAANTVSNALSAPSPVVPGWSQFTYPVSGQLGVQATRSFQWTAVSGSQAYQLQIGTTVGANDVFDSGIITATSIAVPTLVAGRALFARVRAIPVGWGTALSGDFPRGTYVTFRVDTDVRGAVFSFPTAGATADADTPISWQGDPLAQSYRLTLGTSPGGANLLDTGPILSTLRVTSGLAGGSTVYATLYTNYASGITKTNVVSFTVGNPATDSAAMLAVARGLAGQVRGMADADNQPYDATPLAAATASEDDASADCVAFSTALLAELAYANVPLQSRSLAVCFNTNAYDCHELVEVLDPASQRWITLDPTFGMYAVNAAGQPATSGDLSSAVRSMAFGQLTYVYLTPQGASYAQSYYLDYPLMFLNVYQPGSQSLVQPQPSIEPYLDLMGPTVNGAVSGYYNVLCASGSSSATANWDGTPQTYPCDDGFTPIFWGISVVPDGSSGVAVYQPHRFVF
jgi:hypothetical protein